MREQDLNRLSHSDLLDAGVRAGQRSHRDFEHQGGVTSRVYSESSLQEQGLCLANLPWRNRSFLKSCLFGQYAHVAWAHANTANVPADMASHLRPWYDKLLLIFMQNPMWHMRNAAYKRNCMQLPGWKSVPVTIPIALIMGTLCMGNSLWPDFILLYSGCSCSRCSENEV